MKVDFLVLVFRAGRDFPMEREVRELEEGEPCLTKPRGSRGLGDQAHTGGTSPEQRGIQLPTQWYEPHSLEICLSCPFLPYRVLLAFFLIPLLLSQPLDPGGQSTRGELTIWSEDSFDFPSPSSRAAVSSSFCCYFCTGV
jgi:hypothetical protein